MNLIASIVLHLGSLAACTTVGTQVEERLAKEQMDHATKLAIQQIAAAVSSAKATKSAAWAAGLSALV
jgi:hypothetical protein